MMIILANTSLANTRFSRFRLLIVLMSVSAIFGCTSSNADLNMWVENVKEKPPGHISPMPEVKEYKPHEYESSDKQSPFTEINTQIERELKKLQVGCDVEIQPDPERRRESLERYSLDSMEMVG